jgi:hypothetical protein
VELEFGGSGNGKPPNKQRLGFYIGHHLILIRRGSSFRRLLSLVHIRKLEIPVPGHYMIGAAKTCKKKLILVLLAKVRTKLLPHMRHQICLVGILWFPLSDPKVRKRTLIMAHRIDPIDTGLWKQIFTARQVERVKI